MLQPNEVVCANCGFETRWRLCPNCGFDTNENEAMDRRARKAGVDVVPRPQPADYSIQHEHSGIVPREITFEMADSKEVESGRERTILKANPSSDPRNPLSTADTQSLSSSGGKVSVMRGRIHIDFRKIDIWLGICLGIIVHDLVSAYVPHGGHLPLLHAFYFAAPLLVISLLWRERMIGRWKAVGVFITVAGVLLTIAGILNGVL